MEATGYHREASEGATLAALSKISRDLQSVARTAVLGCDLVFASSCLSLASSLCLEDTEVSSHVPWRHTHSLSLNHGVCVCEHHTARATSMRSLTDAHTQVHFSDPLLSHSLFPL